MKTMRKLLMHGLILAVVISLLTISAAAFYTATERNIPFKVVDNAGNPIKGEGWMEITGYYYRNGQTDIFNGREINHASNTTIAWDFTQYEADVTVGGIALHNDTSVRFEYAYSFSKFGNKYAQPANGTFFSNEKPVIVVDRVDVGLTVALKNAAGQAVTEGVTVEVNGQTDNSYPYQFTRLREGRTYTVKVTGAGYNWSGSYEVEKNAKASRTMDANIGTAMFDLYVKPLLGSSAYPYATVTYGDTVLQESGGVYHGRFEAGSRQLKIQGTGLGSYSGSFTVNATNSYTAGSPLTVSISMADIQITNTGDLATGGTRQLGIGTVLRDANYEWSSSDESVAKVDQTGLVTGVTTGTATITVKGYYNGAHLRTATTTVNVSKGSGPMLSGTLGSADTDVSSETIALPANIMGANELTVTAVCTDPKGTAVDQTLTVTDPTAGSTVTVDFGTVLQGPVTYTFVYESDEYTFTTASAAVTKTYYRGIGTPRLAADSFPYTGQPVKPAVTGPEPGTYTTRYVSVLGASSVQDCDPVALTVDNDITQTSFVTGMPVTYEDCPYAVVVTGDAASYYKGSATLTYTVVPRPLTVTPEDQTVPYASDAPLAGLVTAGDGQLLPGHRVQAAVAVDSSDPNKLTVVPGSVEIRDGNGADVSRYYSLTDFGTGVLYTTQTTPVITFTPGQTAVYTYGDGVAAPSFTVEKAYPEDVKLKWYNKETGSADTADPWQEGSTPKNVGTYTVIAYTEEIADRTAAVETAMDISIQPRPLTITAFTAEKAYDGTGEVKNAEVTFGNLVTPDVLVCGTDFTLSALEAPGAGPVGSYPLTARVTLANTAAARNYTLPDGSASGTFTILPATPTAADFVLTPPMENTYTGSPILPSVSVEGSVVGMGEYTVTFYCDGQPVAEPTNAGTYTVKLDVAAGSNYAAVQELVIGTYAIAKADPICTAHTGLAATYGDTLGSVLLTATAGDTPGSWGWTDSTAAVGNAGENSVAAVFTPEDTVNYNTKTVWLTVAVAKKTVAVTGLAAVDREYNGGTTVALTGGSVSGRIDGDDLTVDLSGAVGTVAEADAGADKAVVVTGVKLGGTAADNYELAAQPEGLAVSIHPKNIDLTLGFETTGAMTYAAKALEPALILRDGNADIPADQYSVSYSDNVNAGEATIAVEPVNGGNYTFTPFETTFDIEPAKVKITADSKSVPVGSARPGLTYTVKGLQGEDKLLTEPSLSYEKTPNMNYPGVTAILVSGADAGANYTVEYVKGKLTVYIPATPVTVDMSGIRLENKDYDGRPLTYTGGAKGNYNVQFTYAWYNQYGARVNAPTDAGTYTLRATVSTGGFSGFGEVTAVIEKAQITVTADDLTAEVNGELPALTYTVTGLAAGETLRTEPTLRCDADMTIAGEYPITITGAAGPNTKNYEPTVNCVDGTLTLTEPAAEEETAEEPADESADTSAEENGPLAAPAASADPADGEAAQGDAAPNGDASEETGIGDGHGRWRFPWWILLVIAAVLGGYIWYRKGKNKA